PLGPVATQKQRCRTMTTSTDRSKTTQQDSEVVLLETLPAPVRPKDDWRLSRTTRPLRSWRLSK
ncbi:hypothetical protein ACFPU0_09250, partial [Pseudomonas sp. GCM10022186]|uniref:hypothetical protein n=1 Tax=Pseudomonas sp. GCM10022186 TaxID=3252650 RepID=UPI00360A422D